MLISTVEQLDALYRPGPAATATVKEVARITPDYCRLIEASPFAVLATAGPSGLDCSPRGDRGQVAWVLDEGTLAVPDRRGNNRIDSLRNIVADPRVALLFLIPGVGTTLRVNGRGAITVDPAMLDRFRIKDWLPRTVLLITVDAAYFQCARAVVRSALWDEASRVAASSLPTPGAMLAALSSGDVGGDDYDAQWPARASATLW